MNWFSYAMQVGFVQLTANLFTHWSSCRGDKLSETSLELIHIGSSEIGLPFGNRYVKMSVCGMSSSGKGDL
jgi:hypothetical protein